MGHLSNSSTKVQPPAHTIVIIDKDQAREMMNSHTVLCPRLIWNLIITVPVF